MDLLLPRAPDGGITISGTPERPRTMWRRNLVSPVSELPAPTPVPTHRYEPREVRRQGQPRRSRSPSRRVVVKLGSRSACADGAPTNVGAPSFILVGSASAGTAHTPDDDRNNQHRPPDHRPSQGRPVMLDPVRACRAADVQRGSPEVPHARTASIGAINLPSLRQSDKKASLQNHPISRKLSGEPSLAIEFAQ